MSCSSTLRQGRRKTQQISSGFLAWVALTRSSYTVNLACVPALSDCEQRSTSHLRTNQRRGRKNISKGYGYMNVTNKLKQVMWGKVQLLTFYREKMCLSVEFCTGITRFSVSWPNVKETCYLGSSNTWFSTRYRTILKCLTELSIMHCLESRYTNTNSSLQ